MSAAKLTKFKRICESYCAENPECVDEEKGWRIDLVAIELSARDHIVRHYENIE